MSGILGRARPGLFVLARVDGAAGNSAVESTEARSGATQVVIGGAQAVDQNLPLSGGPQVATAPGGQAATASVAFGGSPLIAGGRAIEVDQAFTGLALATVQGGQAVERDAGRNLLLDPYIPGSQAVETSVGQTGLAQVSDSSSPLAIAYSNQRHLDRTSDGARWQVFWDGGDRLSLRRLPAGASEWVNAGTVPFAGAAANHTPNVSLFIDADDHAHLVYKDRHDGQLYYRRGILDGGLAGWSWASPLTVSTSAWADRPDLVAHRHGTGWAVHLTYVIAEPTKTFIQAARYEMSSTGTVTTASSTGLAFYNVPMFAQASVDFHHTGDGKTVKDSLPHVFYGWATSGGTHATAKGVWSCVQPYSAGWGGGNTRRRLDPVRHVLDDPSTWLTCQFDGTRLVLAGQLLDGTDRHLVAYDRDVADTTTVVHNLHSATTGVLSYGSAGYDSVGNLHLTGVNPTAGQVQLRRWNRSAGTLLPPVSLHTAPALTYTSAHRGHVDDRVELLYTVGVGAHFRLGYTSIRPAALGSQTGTVDTARPGAITLTASGEQVVTSAVAVAGSATVNVPGVQPATPSTARPGTATVALAGAAASTTVTPADGALAVAIGGEGLLSPITARPGATHVVVDGTASSSTTIGISGDLLLAKNGDQAVTADAARPGGVRTGALGTQAATADMALPGQPTIGVSGQAAVERADAYPGAYGIAGEQAADSAAPAAGAVHVTVEGQAAPAVVHTPSAAQFTVTMLGAQPVEQDTAVFAGEVDQTGVSTPLAIAYSNQRHLDRTSDGARWRAYWPGGSKLAVRRLAADGVLWTAVSSVPFTGPDAAFTPNVSLFIDADDHAHLVYKDRHDGQLYYRRGALTADRTDYQWSLPFTISSSPFADRPDLVAHRHGTGWAVHLTYTIMESARTSVQASRLLLASTGAVATASSTGLMTYNAPMFAQASVDFRHTVDSKTPHATPDVFYGWATSGGTHATAKGVWFCKMPYSGGSWGGGNTRRRLDPVRHVLDDPSTWLTCQFDGTRPTLVGQLADSTGARQLVTYDRDIADTTTVAHELQPPITDNIGLLSYGSSSYDANGNIHLTGVSARSGSTIVDLVRRRWTRATQTLTDPDVRRSSSGLSYVSVKRGYSHDRIEFLYTDLSLDPFQVLHEEHRQDIDVLRAGTQLVTATQPRPGALRVALPPTGPAVPTGTSVFTGAVQVTVDGQAAAAEDAPATGTTDVRTDGAAATTAVNPHAGSPAAAPAGATPTVQPTVPVVGAVQVTAAAGPTVLTAVTAVPGALTVRLSGAATIERSTPTAGLPATDLPGTAATDSNIPREGTATVRVAGQPAGTTLTAAGGYHPSGIGVAGQRATLTGAPTSGAVQVVVVGASTTQPTIPVASSILSQVPGRQAPQPTETASGTVHVVLAGARAVTLERPFGTEHIGWDAAHLDRRRPGADLTGAHPGGATLARRASRTALTATGRQTALQRRPTAGQVDPAQAAAQLDRRQATTTATAAPARVAGMPDRDGATVTAEPSNISSLQPRRRTATLEDRP